MKKMLTADAFSVLELPERDLLGALIHVGNITLGEISVLENFLNKSFNNWTISVLSFNQVNVTVQDNVNDLQLTAFCDSVVTVLNATCSFVKI
jgi:hypothetical protein